MKNAILVFVLSLILFSCKSGANKVADKEKSTNDIILKSILNAATNNLGVAYKAAGNTPKGFDCSGLVSYAFMSQNIMLPRSSYDQAKIGQSVSLKDVKNGDLLFFKTNKSNKINHVGLVVSNTPDTIKFIHSSTSKGVIISSMSETYYKNSFVKANRILE